MSTYLSPGATRSSGAINPEYTSTFVFPNDFSALIPITQSQPDQDIDISPIDSNATKTPTTSGADSGTTPNKDLFQSLPAGGECHVMCFSPHSDLSLPLLREEDIQLVIREWMRLSDQLKYNLYVQVSCCVIRRI